MNALVLFSGGQDSTTCLAWALARFDRVETVGFHYGQRHHVEMGCRDKILKRVRSEFPGWETKLGEDHLVSLEALGRISETSLTRDSTIDVCDDGLPNTFVPGRNLLFLTFAAAIAMARNGCDLVAGFCESDGAGYPDCRAGTVDAMQVALQLGLDAPFTIHTPLMKIDKGTTWRLAEELGGVSFVDLVIEETHTCYIGDRSRRHEWGYGCGDCPACKLRDRGFRQYSER